MLDYPDCDGVVRAKCNLKQSGGDQLMDIKNMLTPPPSPYYSTTNFEQYVSFQYALTDEALSDLIF